jgi:hypothetical protein
MRRALSILRHTSLRNYPPASSSSAFAATQSSARSFAATASGLDGITVTKGSAAVQQAVAQQRWVVGDADSFKKCDPCEQGGKPLGRDTALALLQQTPLWTLSDDGTSISRTWVAKVPIPHVSAMYRVMNMLFLVVHSLTLVSGFQKRLFFSATRGCSRRE